MKRSNPRVGILVMIVAIMVLSVSLIGVNDGKEIQIKIDSTEHFEWLILVYVAADNDLGENGEYGNAALMDIEEMESSIPETGVRVLALTDLRGTSNSYLYDVRPDQSAGVNSPTIPLSEVDPSWSDELDMGTGTTLEKFVKYSLTNTSYDRSMFVMWDHGSGWYIDGDISRPPSTRGFAQDENPSRTMMYLDEMRDSFMNVENDIGPFKFDILGHDTCYMGMIEIFYQLSRWSDIATGSMDEQPWYGYNYTFINSLTGPGPHSPEDLAGSMVDLFEMEYGSSSDTYHTIVVADIRIMRDEFISAWDSLSLSLHGRMFHFEEERNGLFDSVVGRSEVIGIDNADVGSILAEVVKKDMDRNVTELASNALSIYNRMVLDSWIKPMGRNPRGTGITIYLPSKNLAYKSQYDGTTGFLDLTADTFWDETIREYQDPVERLRMNLSLMVPVEQGQDHSIRVDVLDMRSDPPIPAVGADVFVNYDSSGITNGTGTFLIEDIVPGNYIVEVFLGSMVDIEQIKALNRPPVAVIDPINPSVGEGLPITLKGNLSNDLDDDPLTYSWDVDDSDGLDDVDSTAPSVTLTFDGKGPRTVRLTVNDTEASHFIDVVVEVFNLDPTSYLICPLTVLEDQVFTLDGSTSIDSPGDMDTLEFRFIIDDVVVSDWSSVSLLETSIMRSGLHIVELQVRDGFGGISTTSSTIDVRNVEPTAILNGPAVLFEDEIGSFYANASHDTATDMGSLVYLWYADGSEDPIGSGETLNFSWELSGSHFLDLHVYDGEPEGIDTLMNTTRIAVRVDNVPPVAVVVGPSMVNESETIILDGSNSHDSPSDLDDLDLKWDMDNDGVFETSGISASYIFDTASIAIITLKVTDDDGDISLFDHEITVYNVAPTPNFTAPIEVQEDEIIDIELVGKWDTRNDIPDLSINWELDGILIGTGIEPPENLVITTSGVHEIGVIVEDDQNDRVEYIHSIIVKNPIPRVTLTGVPTTIFEDESFTADGSGSTDNPSDIDTLTFQWLLDGEPIEGETGKTATFSFNSPGIRTIQLMVTDDDGDNYTASLTVEVEETPLIVKVVQSIFSTVGLSLIMLILILLVILIVRVRNNVKNLKPPGKGPTLDQDEDDQDVELTDDDNVQDPPFDGENDPIGEDAKEDPIKEGLLFDDEEEGPSGDVPSMDIEDMELPDAPLVEDMDIPDPEEDLLGPLHIQ